MGWGMVSELQQAATPASLLEEVFPGRSVDVVLYWQHWAREAVSAQRLTAAATTALRRRSQAFYAGGERR